MYNLNVDLAQSAANAANSLLVESTTNTPRTPEILNSLIAMTNPLDSFAYGDGPGKRTTANGLLSMSSDSNSSSSSQVESPTTNPPSVQHTCSQLIKAGLKLTIEQKRKHQNDGDDLLDLDKVKRIKKSECSESEEDKIKQEIGLTPEDEERRRRRRERNKIAATKCRLKKRERTANLVQESETLETQNTDFKVQIKELQNQKQTLMGILAIHRPQCQHNIAPVTRDHLYRLPPVSSVMDNHLTTYNSRPSSVDHSYHNSGMDIFSRPASVGVSNHLIYSNNHRQQLICRPPAIIIEDASTSDNYEISEFEDLDYTYNCHNYSSGNQGGYTTTNSSGMDNGCMA